MSHMNLRTEIETYVADLAPLLVADQLRNVLAKTAPRVLTTLEDLDSHEAFGAFCIMPAGGPLRVPVSRMDGVNFWQEPGFDGEYTSSELLAHFASIGVEPAFTLIEVA